jgi:limonene-1,2-epoxide hydrolase
VPRFGSSTVERMEHHCTIQKGDEAEPENYRPVSLTSVVCKTMEKQVREIIVKHMSANKLFSNKQFGFITGKSTTLQLLKVMDE